jgi:tetratricopeptide (TPR) repeat protein
MHSRTPLARWAVLLIGLGLTVSACGKYSINNLKAVKAFKDANVLYQKNDYAEAVVLYQEVVDRQPDMVSDGKSLLGTAYFYLANSYGNMYKATKKGDPVNDGYLQKAADTYKLATEHLKGDGDTLYRKRSYEFLLDTYGPEKLNDFDKAEPIAKELIALDPNEPTSYQTLGKLYEDLGRYDEAEAAFLKAVDLKPNSPEVYQVLAGYYNRQGEFDKTMAALAKRAENEPNNPEAFHYMATFYEEKVQKDLKITAAQRMDYIMKGIAADDRALQLNPEYAEAMSYKNILMRFEANAIKDPAKQKELIKEADDLLAKSKDLAKKQNVAAAGKGKGGN